jgi:hypothetical protein
MELITSLSIAHGAWHVLDRDRTRRKPPFKENKDQSLENKTSNKTRKNQVAKPEKVENVHVGREISLWEGDDGDGDEGGVIRRFVRC